MAFGSHDARGTTGYVLRTGEPQLLTSSGTTAGRAGRDRAARGDDRRDSWLGVPLKAEDTTIGVLVVQSYIKDVRYTEQDKDLLAFVGQHVGAALSRARAIEETRQRNAELALINSVQEALAGELEMQAIYDVVGDKIEEIFDAQCVAIRSSTRPRRPERFPYLVERGPSGQSATLGRGFTSHVLETREPLLIRENLDAEASGTALVVMAGEMPKSRWGVPLITGGRGDRVISLENFDRERLRRGRPTAACETLAGSLSVALENARLVHETRQRNAELALINSVQEALAGELEMQAIYDVVGTRSRRSSTRRLSTSGRTTSRLPWRIVILDRAG